MIRLENIETEITFIDGKEVRQSTLYPNYGSTFCGRVYRLDSGKEMTKTFRTSIGGYNTVRVCHNNIPKNAKVCRVVASSWWVNPNSELYDQVNHKDGNKINDNADNLEWCSASQNQRHAIQEGLKGKGENLYNSQLSDDEVHLLCKKLTDGSTVKDLSKEFNVSKDIVRKIRSGDSYFHIRSLYNNIPHNYRNEFSEKTVRWVCSKIVEGFGDEPIAKLSSNEKISKYEIKRIRYKIRYSYISDEYF